MRRQAMCHSPVGTARNRGSAVRQSHCSHSYVLARGPLACRWNRISGSSRGEPNRSAVATRNEAGPILASDASTILETISSDLATRILGSSSSPGRHRKRPQCPWRWYREPDERRREQVGDERPDTVDTSITSGSRSIGGRHHRPNPLATAPPGRLKREASGATFETPPIRWKRDVRFG